MSAFAGDTIIYRDGQGRKIMSASCHDNTIVYRDAVGRKIGEAKVQKGKTTYRDASGRKIGESDAAISPQSSTAGKTHLTFSPESSKAESLQDVLSCCEDFSLLRKTNEMRARNRLGAADAKNVQKTGTCEARPVEQKMNLTPGTIMRAAVGVCVAIPMILIVGTTGVIVWILG